MNPAMLENLEHELELAANVLSMSPEAEAAASTTSIYYDSWTWTASGWQYLGRDGPFPSMTKQAALSHVLTLQLKYRTKAQSLGGGTPFVQCFAYLPISKQWVACQSWF